MNIKTYLKSHLITKRLYEQLKERKIQDELKRNIKFSGRYIDRSKGRKILCVILAGYKEPLYPAVFSRIEKNVLPEMDICIVTSGVFSEYINDLCEKNSWSYLSTKENNVSLVQNVAIHKHPKAKYIFKLDEDIFITKNFFQNMLETYIKIQNGGGVLSWRISAAFAD